MKKQKGITLIALIITIVVMLILVAVTLMIALGENGIITTTKNARDEHEAEAFREYVEIAAAGNFDGTYDWGEGFNANGKYNWKAIEEEIKMKYPEANFTYLAGSLPRSALSTNNLEIIEGNVYCAQAILKHIEENNLKGTITEAQRTELEAALQKAKQDYVKKIKDENPESTLTENDITIEVGTASTGDLLRLGPTLIVSMYGMGASMIVEYNGINVPIGFVNSNAYDYYVIMNKSEAEKLFEFTYTTEDGMQLATVKLYKGNSKNVKVPGTLIDENGNSINVIGIEAGAFYKAYMKVPVINFVTGSDADNTDYDKFLYNNTATLAEFKTEIGMDELEFNCVHPEGNQCTKITCKNELLKVIVGSATSKDLEEAGIGLGDDPILDCLDVDSEGILYGYFRLDLDSGMAIAVKPSEFVENNIQSVIVSEGIETIGERAFCLCSKLTTIYIPETIESIDSGAFEGCFSLTEMTTMNKDIANSTSNYGCPNDITKIFIEQTVDAEYEN